MRRLRGNEMGKQVDYYNTTYASFSDQVLATVRRETFNQDIGQNSWLTADEFRSFGEWLGLGGNRQVLEVACGSGGPDLFLARTFDCRVIGVDNNPNGIATANQLAHAAKMTERVRFQVADANDRLPFDDESFDAIICIDAINHLAHRLDVLREWRRVLKTDARILYTDPIIVTGAISNAEIAIRSSIGFFLFVPLGENEKVIEQAGLRLLRREDVTENVASVSQRWHAARERHRDDLITIEGQERFDAFQSFFAVVHRLSSERRLSRVAYLAEK